MHSSHHRLVETSPPRGGCLVSRDQLQRGVHAVRKHLKTELFPLSTSGLLGNCSAGCSSPSLLSVQLQSSTYVIWAAGAYRIVWLQVYALSPHRSSFLLSLQWGLLLTHLLELTCRWLQGSRPFLGEEQGLCSLQLLLQQTGILQILQM